MSAWTPEVGCETHEWRSALGETIRFVTRIEAEGRMLPPVSVQTAKLPLAGGSRFRTARHDERVVLVPVVVPGPQDGRAELRSWARALDPTKGEGTLTVVDGPYAGRQLSCVYDGGLETFQEQYPGLGLTTLAFRAADPYWYDSTENQITLTTGGDRLWFPFPPLVLSPMEVWGGATITNVGDVGAYPVFTIEGPGDVLTVTNETTGEWWEMRYRFFAGETLVVDTRPGRKSARLDGANVFVGLWPESVLFPFAAGPNQITIALTEASGDTSVRITWRNRWLAA